MSGVGFCRPNGEDRTTWLLPAQFSEIPKTEETMIKLAETSGVRLSDLEGFTLFWHQGKGWQRSVRRKGSPGWSIEFISDDDAKATFQLLGAAVPAVPALVVEPAAASGGLLGALQGLGEALAQLNETIRV
jgi:hypothetical protein